MKKLTSEDDFDEIALNEETCREYLKYIRWGGKIMCPHCKYDQICEFKCGKRYKCKNFYCSKKFQVTTGTIFERSRVPLKTWFKVIYGQCEDRDGLPAHRTFSIRKFKSYPTAWYAHHRVMQLFEANHDGLEPVDGTFEIDYMECGVVLSKMTKKRRAKHTNKAGTSHLTPILSIMNRGNSLYGKVMLKGKSKVETNKVLERVIGTGSVLCSDADVRFKGFGQSVIYHWRLNHTKGIYSLGDGINTSRLDNSIEGFRNVEDRYQYISRKYLQRYWDEYAFKYTRQSIRKMQPWEIFEEAMANIENKITLSELKTSYR